VVLEYPLLVGDRRMPLLPNDQAWLAAATLE
jgi:hypothetical protein